MAFVIHATLRFLQFVFALAVLGLYGTDLNNARKKHVYADKKWVYAEVVGGLAALTCLVYMIPFKSYLAFGWDAVML